MRMFKVCRGCLLIVRKCTLRSNSFELAEIPFNPGVISLLESTSSLTEMIT